tara:strand:- start:6 stop:875 length:870 start_codon:yes stop_codon:yes gene_type:complete
MAYLPLVGKVALVTGAGSRIGLGRVMTIALINAGAKVAILDVDEIGLNQTEKEIEKIGGEGSFLTQVCDISKSQSVDKAVENIVNTFGSVHILINNAGIMIPSEMVKNSKSINNKPYVANFWDIPSRTWSKVIDVNVNGTFNMVRATVGHMISQKWGRIIGITTSLDTMYSKGMAPYGPSKAAHEAFIGLMARELEGTGVTANALIPGGTTDTNLLPVKMKNKMETLINPEVMQAPVVWLASEDSNSINGQRLIAYNWDEDLPIEKRLEKACAPVAWPQLGNQNVNAFT